MIEQIVLGTVQGIAEWLPISSEGAIFLVSSNFFGEQDVAELLRQALFLHLGTFLATLVYFWKDVVKVFQTLIGYKSAVPGQKNQLKFLVIATLISGGIGLVVLTFITSTDFTATAKAVNVVIGISLLVTAFLQIRAGQGGLRLLDHINNSDSVLLGIAQGMATLPGLSRSGLTISALLLRKVNDELALKLSFLLSLPIVLAGNIALNFKEFAFQAEMLIGLLFSFGFGLITIHVLLKLARKINFGYFVLVFAVLVLAATFI